MPFGRQQAESIMLRGSVTGQHPSSQLMVELDNAGSMMSSARAEISHQGAFTFMSVPVGQYMLKITDMHGNVIHREFVDVGPARGPLLISLPQKQEEPARGGVVSLKRLQHKVPREARKEYERAEKAMEKDELEKSIAHLEKAAALDPEFVEAFVNLGARRLRQGRPELALAAFERAIAIDGTLSLAHSNAATALLMLNRPAGAERAAERAIEINPMNLRARYMLGLALLQQEEDLDKAVTNLQRACDEFPMARIPIAHAFAALGKRAEAKSELETYLASGRPEQRAEAETMLSRLDAR